jgi:2',3'-cyclic-nucleotide 2'-phosphodiesterase/3'-nucleotidase
MTDARTSPGDLPADDDDAADDDNAPAAVVDLRILATSDLHSHLLPYDYHADRPEPGIGLARTAVLIAEERAAAANSLLFDNGDFLQGNPLADCVAARRGLAAGAPHPVVAAMNALGYDAAALGNHEFNYGLAFLAQVLAAARFAVVAANVAPLDPGADLARPWAMLGRVMRDRTGRPWPLRIAVAGFLPPQITVWDHPHLAGRLRTEGIVAAARRIVPQMRAAGADLVIALCHSGAGPDLPPEAADPAAENAAIALARLPGIDAVIAGHSHVAFPGPAAEAPPGSDPRAGRFGPTPAVMPGYAGSHLGVIDLSLARGRGGRWRVVAARGRLRAVAALPPGAAAAPVVAAALRDHAATLAHVRSPVGETAVPLRSYLALAEPVAAVRLLAEAQRDHAVAMLAGTPHAGLPVLAAAAPLRAGGRGGPRHYTDVAAGPLAVRHIADLSPYPNTICALRLTGADIRRWLDHAARAFRQVAPGARDALLIDPDWPGYYFDTIEGVTYTIDLAAPPGGGRVRDLRLGGVPLADDRPVILATSTYRAFGGGGFPGAGPDAVVHVGRETIGGVLAAHLRRVGRYAPRAPPPWRFAPMPATSILVKTGPGVRAELGPGGGTIAGETAGGFVLVRRGL